MTARAKRSKVGTATALIASVTLLLTASPAGAHGVEIMADLDGQPARLELTDETGEICLRAGSAVEPTDTITLVVLASAEKVLDLGGGFGTEEVCQFLDTDAVDAVLADVDGHELVVRRQDGSVARATLQKPLPPSSETAIGDTAIGDPTTDNPATDDPATGGSDLNVPLIFAIGAGLGVAIAVLRKRFRAPTR